MLPQIHFNFGPTAFDRVYQLSLPIIPGGVFVGGLFQARPDLFITLRSAVSLHPYASFAVFVFAAYVAGFVLFLVSAMLTGIVSGITQGLVLQSWTPLRASYSLSQCTIWRQVASKFLGELAAALPENPAPTTVIEKVMRPMKELTEKRQNDELWEEWYRILQDYLLRGTPQISNDAWFVWIAAHATAWAIVFLAFVNTHVRHWWAYVPAVILILLGSLFPFLITLSYVSSERLAYWDFTARLLAEIKGNAGQVAEMADKTPSEDR